MDKRNKSLRKRRAFTLIEVLLAIALISMLAFIVVTNVDKTMTGGQTKIAETFVRNSIAVPLMNFKLNVGRYPTTEEGLNALMKSPDSIADRWKGPYLTHNPADPWGNPYQYCSPAKNSSGGYDIWSMGPDAKSGTEDDIGNW